MSAILDFFLSVPFFWICSLLVTGALIFAAVYYVNSIRKKKKKLRRNVEIFLFFRSFFSFRATVSPPARQSVRLGERLSEPDRYVSQRQRLGDTWNSDAHCADRSDAHRWQLDRVPAQCAVGCVARSSVRSEGKFTSPLEFIFSLFFLCLFQLLLFSVMGSKHLFDATEIFSQLSLHKKINVFKLGFYMVLFFVFLYR